ncbi:hypothetical protein CMK18_00285 [Candidatus Poribacteria bacterium]|nr:hypothetical protein [Candidatus Poribacteria bacterium]
MPIFVMSIAFIILCGVGRSLVGSSKEYVILSFMRVVVIVMGWRYSKNFLNNVDGINSKYMMDIRFLPLIFVMRGLGFMSVDVVIIGIVILCMRMVNIGNMYIVNK